MKPLVSVVMVTFNRAGLLRRSAACYNRSRFDLSRLEIIVVDDGSYDATVDLCDCLDESGNSNGGVLGFSSGIDLTYLRVRKPIGLWRDCAVNINRGIRAAKGDLILCTHPEVMVGRDTLQECLDLATNKNYVCAKPYYLKPNEQDAIDTVDWLNEGPLAVRKLPTFYNTVPGGAPDFEARAIEQHTQWRSFVFGGHSRQMWKRLGGIPETQQWGAVDIVWSKRRDILGIPDTVCMSEQSLCVHQWHPAPRDHKPWQDEVDKMDMSPDKLSWPEVDELRW